MFGGCVRLVGSLDALGAWNPEHGVELSTTLETYPRWTAVVRLSADAVFRGDVEYKFVVVQPDGSFEWEERANRQLTPSMLPGHPSKQAVPRAPAQQLVDVVFEAKCSETLPGDCLFAVGAHGALGGWEPTRGLRLSTLHTKYPSWCGVARIGAGEPLGRWKLTMLRADGSLDWETGEDRDIGLPHVGSGEALVVRASFNGEGAAVVEAKVGRPSDMSAPLMLEWLQGGTGGCQELEAVRMHMPKEPKAHSAEATENAEAICCKHFARPSSTASTASTCTSEDDRDARELLAEARPFSKKVFDGLFDEDLRLRLQGKVPTAPPADADDEHPRSLWLWSGAHRIEKPCGRCEDAFFHSSHALGVADGVGSMAQFAKYGTDAAAYAAELMQSASAALGPSGAARRRTGEGPAAQAAAAMHAAETEARSYGASTITVLAMDGDKVGVANLGDSGFMLLRKAADGVVIAARSEEQQHRWNCPYQLVRLPPALLARLPKGQDMDSAADSQRYEVQVKPGDLLLVFTDGMCDNMHDHEVLQIANRALAPALSELAGLAGFATPPERVARALALAAQERSLDLLANVPFWQASRRFCQDARFGGKPDDITVVAAWVMPEASNPGPAQ